MRHRQPLHLGRDPTPAHAARTGLIVGLVIGPKLDLRPLQPRQLKILNNVPRRMSALAKVLALRT